MVGLPPAVPVVSPGPVLTAAERTRFARHLLLPGFGEEGQPKVESAAQAVLRLSSHVEVAALNARLTADNVLEVLAGHDVVVDGADNFPTRYLVSDACARLGLPHVWGSIHRFDAQLSVWWAGRGPCYRCAFPIEPSGDAVPSCAVGGVLGLWSECRLLATTRNRPGRGWFGGLAGCSFGAGACRLGC